jgi:hypothetical protein
LPGSLTDQNTNTGRERDDVEQKNCRPEIHAEAQKAVDDQINREQNHADASSNFHARHLTAEDTEGTEEKFHSEKGSLLVTGQSSLACQAVAFSEGWSL